MKKRLVIYDFDGTIFFSPNKEQGEKICAKNGMNWMHTGWWGRKESLLPPIVEKNPPKSQYNEIVNEAYLKDKKDKNCSVILMTGRPFYMEKRIKEICENNNMLFDSYYFSGSPGHIGNSTLEMKINFIEKNINENLEILEIWEDRPDQIKGFSEKIEFWKEKYPSLKYVKIHQVK